MRLDPIKRAALFLLCAASAGAAPTEAATTEAPSQPDGLVTYTETRAPCSERFPLRKALFGELHLHSSYSFDAYAQGTRNDPEAAFDFARGHPITLVSGGRSETLQLSRPLDFAAVTDHAEFLGVFDLCMQNGSASYNTIECRDYRRSRLRRARSEEDLTGSSGNNRGPLTNIIADAWSRSQQVVEAAYDRTSACTFTAFNAFEYSATPNGNMNHRNVIFRNASVPTLPIGFLDEGTPQELWDRLDTECTNANTGCDVLAIPHNPNLSSGILFDLEYGGLTDPDDQADLGRQRVRLEPLVEIYQHKGASECSPAFGSEEQCAFELLAQTDCAEDTGTVGLLTGCTTPLNFVRGVLAQGLAEKERIGVNPFKLGIVASTDSHNGNPGNAGEAGWVGHGGDADADTVNSDPEFSPGGLVGVWSVENSRDAIFEALRRRETFGTSGPRIQVRLFAGWSYPQDMCSRADALQIGYDDGVPMGGTVSGDDVARRARQAGPRFFFQALNDDMPLQVAQIVKLWVDARTGELEERVYDIAGNKHNGASVDLNTCATSGAGATSMCASWADPDFDPARAAVYYARVLENPTCRWIQHLCIVEPDPQNLPANCVDDSVAKTVQERAWSSPIWYEPPTQRRR